MEIGRQNNERYTFYFIIQINAAQILRDMKSASHTGIQYNALLLFIYDLFIRLPERENESERQRETMHHKKECRDSCK